MMGIIDAITLAHTKLRTHRVRTGLTIGLAGLLFGLTLAAVFLVQGVFDSVERFSKEGLNDRAIVAINRTQATFNVYEHMDDAAFISEVESLQRAIIKKKTAAATKYGVTYDAKTEDVSPIEISKETGKKAISDVGLASQAVQEATTRRQTALEKADTFDIHEFLKKYPSAKVLPNNFMITAPQGSLKIMKDSREVMSNASTTTSMAQFYGNSDTPALWVYDGSLVKPFITASFDPTSGEIPVVIPYSHAEKLLHLKALGSQDSREAKLKRLQEVRRRANEIAVQYCYRNVASEQLLAEAVAQTKAKAALKASETYSVPIEYKLPTDTSCGATAIVKDSRSSAEKQQALNQENYQKAIGQFIGVPEQRKITFRVVGISADVDISASQSSIGQLVSGLLGSNLGHNAWAIPSNLLQQVPDKYHPSAVFTNTAAETTYNGPGYSMWFVEFGNKDEARKLVMAQQNSSQLFAFPFGSGMLLVSEAKAYFSQFLFWGLIGLGVVASLILTGLIGRTVADGRRESAVFRAIGAKRLDISAIYGSYALLLSLQVMLFAGVLGLVVAMIIEVLYAGDATLAARLAYAAKDTNVEFHLIGLMSWYVPAIFGTILVVGLLGSVIPIIRSVRRNPINDMRDE